MKINWGRYKYGHIIQLSSHRQHHDRYLLHKATQTAMDKWSHKRVSSLEGASLLALYYLSALEIWPDNKRGGLWWEWPYKRGTTVNIGIIIRFF